MRSLTAPRAHVKPPCTSLASSYVAVLRMDDGTTIRSVALADRETAEKVAMYSLLDSDVIETRVEEVRAEQPAGPAQLPPR